MNRYLLLPDESGDEGGPCARLWTRFRMTKWDVNVFKIDMILRDKSVLRNADIEKRRWFQVVSKFSLRSRIRSFLGYEVR